MVLSFKLDLQLCAAHKGVGSTKNGRDSAGRRLGAKRSDGQICKAAAIIYRQRGTRVYPGINTKKGSDDTIFALKEGIVRFERVGKNRKRVSVYEIEK